MKKVANKQSPPKLYGRCAPPRGALVAMDAEAVAGGRGRGERPHSPVVSGPRGAEPRLQQGTLS